MPIVFACAASHAPGITACTEAAPKEQSEKIVGGYEKLRQMLQAARPEALVAITVEHWANFFLNQMPAFCLGRADHYDGPIEEWLRIPKTRVPGDSQFASQLLDSCYHAGFDLTFSDELLFDHATMLPLHFLIPRMDIAVIPLIVNALTPPMPTPRRCYELGKVLGEAFERTEKKVAIVATGGLSHWPGEPKAGKINTEFDREFLEALTDGNHGRLAGYTHAELAEAGSGAHEVRTWIALAAAVRNWKAQLLAYEPVVPWATGCGLVIFHSRGSMSG
ncbi:MAG TPA: AmmeMemoRadiSam system protein B [Candidatus Binatia bacterium]|jgi:2,3-dihydroxyphenylpropionate 1,2-dioxygenase|nr:AmmeMemoRadiSam system protein B [Candidatus Binatia bacterium]